MRIANEDLDVISCPILQKRVFKRCFIMFMFAPSQVEGRILPASKSRVLSKRVSLYKVRAASVNTQIRQQ